MKNRTYRFFQGEPLYPFGYGLSYTTFSYRNLRVPRQAPAGSPVKLSVQVTNEFALPPRNPGEIEVTVANLSAPCRLTGAP